MHRFYLPSGSWDAKSLALEEAEAHHAVNVLRLRAGERVVVFDGAGREATAEILEGASKRAVPLKVLHSQQSPPLACRLTLAQAIPKGKNMDLIIQKATELGAAEIQPLLSERTVARCDDIAEAAAKQEKWQQVAIEAAKQCGQNWLPTIGRPRPPKDFLAERARDFDLLLIASLQPDAKHPRVWLRDHPTPRRALILVGPEGDFTPAEIGLAKAAGCHPITLGPIILRTETAALYCLSVLSYELLNREA
ncbi:MAG: 16S rRNA (uracil(1498)-N(3))-methyltransferase [Verrucomicrobia bacterium]|nr:16S rRNA (uracil(1498)-N(3))-methyltransferase [Verrucomicrobiota bacterium]